MSRSRPHQLEQDLEALKRDHDLTDAPTNVTVEWRDADPEPRPDGIAFDPETATLTYDLWSAQQDCRAALEAETTDIVAFLGGYGSGKSVVGARWLLAQALTHRSQFLAMGISYAKANHTTFLKLFAQLPGDGTRTDPERSPLVADYVASKRLLTLTNGSVIVLGSADSWTRYAGAEFGAIWLDEPSHYETDLHDLLEMLCFRLRGVAGPKRQCWTLTGNGYNDAWEILEQRRDSTGEPLDHEIELIRASTLENPYLEADVRADYERQYGSSARAEQALYGTFAAATGLVYSTFTRETHVLSHTEAIDRVSGDWRVYGYDAGWNDPRVLLEVGKTGYDQLVVLDAFYAAECHVEDVIEWLETNAKPQGSLYCEHDPEELAKFRHAGYRVERATKSLDAGIAEVRKRLEADGNRPVHSQSPRRQKFVRRSASEKGGRRRIEIPRTPTPATPDSTGDRDGRRGLLVSDRCQPLIREFLGYKEEHVGKSVADDHCLDALRYLCMGVAGH